ncbi:MAG: hypothetical protein QNJ47_01290 [Nostocaceae cyanobacterium]|nr:hypothetical protein [Nostocaceae cyanobacterium]
MRVKYLATLATISMLSLGFVAGCTNPCAAKTKNNTETTNEVNPCASKNPCAAKNKINPCASKNPCAAKNK